MESWMKAVTCANYDYMKLMVSELQQKLDEINAEAAVSAQALNARSLRNLVGPGHFIKF